MSVTAPSAFRIEQAMSVAQTVKQRLLDDDPDLAADETALRDTLDGETDVFDVLRRLVRFTLDAESMSEAAKLRAANLVARQKRFAARAEAARGAIFGMMDALGEKTFTDPEFVASIKAGRPSVCITDDAAIPDVYVEVSRTVKKSAIAAALKAGEIVSGAELSNAPPSLQIKAT